MALTDDDVREILRLIDESGLDELQIEMEGFSLHVRRGASTEDLERLPNRPRAPAVTEGPAPSPVHLVTPLPDEPPPPLDDAPTVDAPMLGTFYRAEAPGRAPFVDVGSEVEPGTVVCLIEVMKMMNSIEAGVAGTVIDVCADNAQLVEYGQPLFRIRPTAAQDPGTSAGGA
jgi:acetyl-CoA carboxylase biotin carboxyl carrier protein